ncbi:hypothetical protein [Shewanella sp. SR44-3]|uniref:hypothetical protein n=1 Tax=Shewanella sp. SR44-3 TaxID=2760936 RepID=UPI0015F9D706|nr:hypothetical protein [Shewanella sp. SR44-3]MBB1268399.1 hypothetical protein [Shewanella sp. SR44-3]
MKTGHSVQITIEQWQQFSLGLRHYGDAQDWPNLVKLNQLLIKALHQVAREDFNETPQQALARVEVEKVHTQVLRDLKRARDQLSSELSGFKSSQAGLLAYQFTCISGEVDDI